MGEYNFFLTPGGKPSFKGGGGGFVEDPRAVENSVFQTRGGPLGAFEAKFAEDLMQVFGEGAEELGEVVAGLNVAGSRDGKGGAWTETSLAAQLAACAPLFQTFEEGSTRG